jgi:hypothetical protein
MWRSRVSIPVPPACKAGALPFELHPHLLSKFSCTTSREEDEVRQYVLVYDFKSLTDSVEFSILSRNLICNASEYSNFMLQPKTPDGLTIIEKYSSGSHGAIEEGIGDSVHTYLLTPWVAVVVVGRSSLTHRMHTFFSSCDSEPNVRDQDPYGAQSGSTPVRILGRVVKALA